jgi:hypothetical protein
MIGVPTSMKIAFIQPPIRTTHDMIRRSDTLFINFVGGINKRLSIQSMRCLFFFHTHIYIEYNRAYNLLNQESQAVFLCE